ncbi:hypothetical protein AYL99_05302 [Fonsecaea erecta]|uniref:Uncharacterized protein n=1 Tax=Fonsecaea erecta TaxID=1367422 RepID=A0A178ZKH4_9EURO|nr:hypothetical protein AYL99_05302 [Fonsecaea erecta]OAP60300.1 hypothetical protein AYL99_05302 [Fonsecaea erecta]
MTGSREIPVIVITPPPEESPTSTVSILTARHWGLWAKGCLRKLDCTSAKGYNYSTMTDDDDVELVDLLPRAAPTAGKLPTEPQDKVAAEARHRQVEAHDRPVTETPLDERSNKGHKQTEEADRHGAKATSPKRFVDIDVERAAASELDKLVFYKKHLAVLESIRFRGDMMRAFEQECKQPWFNPSEFEDDLPPLLPQTTHIRRKAEELLKDLVENPIPDIGDMLEAKGQRKTSVCMAWHVVLESHGRDIGKKALFEPVVLGDWKEDSCQTWEEILNQKSRDY